MAFLDIQHRELTLKLVYYGPARSGKTTNLRQLHRLFGADAASELITLDTRDDRTLFFDLLPLRLAPEVGIGIKLKLFTVPGQVMHAATRRVVLQGADGVAFIADSQRGQTRDNNESYADLKCNLADNGMAFEDTAVVVQFNKRDLPNIHTADEVAAFARSGPESVVLASALHGQGVAETLLALVRDTWERLEPRLSLQSQFSVRAHNVLDSLKHAMGRLTHV